MRLTAPQQGIEPLFLRPASKRKKHDFLDIWNFQGLLFYTRGRQPRAGRGKDSGTPECDSDKLLICRQFVFFVFEKSAHLFSQ